MRRPTGLRDRETDPPRGSPPSPAQLCQLCGPAPVSLQRPPPSVAPGAAGEAGVGASHAAAPLRPLPRGLGFGGGCHEADRPGGPAGAGGRGEVRGGGGGRLARLWLTVGAQQMFAQLRDKVAWGHRATGGRGRGKGWPRPVGGGSLALQRERAGIRGGSGDR